MQYFFVHIKKTEKQFYVCCKNAKLFALKMIASLKLTKMGLFRYHFFLKGSIKMTFKGIKNDDMLWGHRKLCHNALLRFPVLFGANNNSLKQHTFYSLPF
jgi:hypothetical protein